MLVSLVFIILSPILAQLIYFALSRRREYLADASGAMFTRWPEGLASALEKLGSNTRPQADQSQVTAPMYIVRPLREGERRSVTSAFATHPPLEERIRVLRAWAATPILRLMTGPSRRPQASTWWAHARWEQWGRLRSRRAPERSRFADAARTPAGRFQRLSGGAGYDRVECGQCGAILKIPAGHRGRVQACPRCRARV